MMARGLLLAGALVAAAAVVAVGLVAGDRLARGHPPVAAATSLAGSQHREGVVPPSVLRVPLCSPGSLVRFDNPRVSYAVTVRRTAVAYRAPGTHPFARFARLNVNGVPTVF